MTSSFRIESISVPSDPTTDSGQIDTPLQRTAASGGSDPLSSPQVAAVIGDSVPIVFGRRVGAVGGVLVSPTATEARFENDATNAVTARYLLVISEGKIDGIPVKDVFQQSCRVGAFTQAYNRRAGDWGPGNFIVAQPGFENEVPDCPIYCGTATGSYAGMTTGSFTVTIPGNLRERDQWNRQVHIFARGGMEVTRLLDGIDGPSNNVVDLSRWGIERTSRVPAALIDDDALLLAARFTDAAGLWFNGKINDPTNLADWIAEVLPYFLLREARAGGKRGLRPLLPVIEATGAINTGVIPAVRSYTDDEVVPGSVDITYISRQDRLPFTVQMVWRQQPEDGLGLARTANVRYGGSALDGPFEQHDMSAYATSETHAFRVGAFILARRRYIEHRMTLQVLPGDVRDILTQGDIVRVTLQRTANIGSSIPLDFLYEVDRVARTPDGGIQMELTHFPVDDAGRSLVARDVLAAVGNGLLLPTGRAPVNCDINDPTDNTVPPDFGPWPGWDIGLFDPPIFDLDFEINWPDGIEIDNGTGWGPGGVGADNQDPRWRWNQSTSPPRWESIGPPKAGWTWNPQDQKWKPTDPDAGIPQAPIPNLPPSNPPAGPAPEAISVTFTQPYIVYPDVFYTALGGAGLVNLDEGDGGYAQVNFAVGVGTAPNQHTQPFQIFVTDGTLTPILESGGKVIGGGFGTQFSFILNNGQTKTPEITINGVVDATDMANARCTPRKLNMSGARANRPTVIGPGERYPVQTFTASPQDYNICPYVGTLEWKELGAWEWKNNRWDWLTDTPFPSGWTWNAANQQWATTSTDPNWSWDAAQNFWIYTGSAFPQPQPPPLPPPIPDSRPSDSSLGTHTVRVSIDKMPVGDHLKVRINSTGSEGLVATITIPAVSALWGKWRWVAATEEWERRGDTGDWRWHSQQKTWQWLGAGNPPVGTEPTQGGSIYPPDASTWTWNGSAWVGGVYAQNGSPPVGPWYGATTFHVLRSTTFINAGTTAGGYSTVNLPLPLRLMQGEFVLTFSIFNATKYWSAFTDPPYLADLETVWGVTWPQFWAEYQRQFKAKPLSRMHVEVQVVPTLGLFMPGGTIPQDAYLLPVPPDDTFIFETIEHDFPDDQYGTVVTNTGGLPLKQSWKDIIDRYRPTIVYFVADYASGNSVSDYPNTGRSVWEPALIEMRQYLLTYYPTCKFEPYFFYAGPMFFAGAPGPSFVPTTIPGKATLYPITEWPNPSINPTPPWQRP